MRKIITILLITASTFLYSQSMNLNNNKIRIVDNTMGLGITPTSRLHVFGNGTTSNLFNVTNDKDATKDSSVVVNAVGNVGIGTTTPTYKLQISDENGGGQLRFTRGTGEVTFTQELNKNNLLIYATDGFIINAGNVGIGTIRPYSTLNVGGNGSNINGKGIIIGTVGDAINTNVPKYAEVGRFEIGFPGYRNKAPNQIGAKIASVRYNNYNDGVAYIQSSDLVFYTGTGNYTSTTDFVDNTTEALRITSAGNVGIGTTTPTSRLHVFGNGTASNLFNVTNDKDATKDSSIIIKANGGVILGDSSYYLNGNGVNYGVSESRLTIIGGVPLRLLNSHNKGYTSLKWSARTDKDTIADYAQIMGNVEKNTFGLHSGSLYFQTAKGGGLSTRMYIDSAGKVGIGTTTPNYKLDIFGNGGTDNLFKVSNDINSTYDSTFVIKSNGYVGIGNNNPNNPLQVWGSGDCHNIYSEYSGSYARAAVSGRALGSDGYGIVGTAGTIGAKAGLFNNYAGGTALEVMASIGSIAIKVKSGDVVVDSTRFLSRSITLSDNEQYAFPPNLSWKGEIDVDSLGYTLFTAQIRCDANSTPYLEGVSWKRWKSKTYAQVGSLDGYLNIIGTGSNNLVITNTLGYTIKATLRFRTKQ